MSTIIADSELLHRALKWFSDERVARPHEHLSTLVEEASVHYNLSPAQEEWLLNTMMAAPTSSAD